MRGKLDERLVFDNMFTVGNLSTYQFADKRKKSRITVQQIPVPPNSIGLPYFIAIANSFLK